MRIGQTGWPFLRPAPEVRPMNEQTVFEEALSRPAGERSAFLDVACAGRPDLRAAVETLLAEHEHSEHRHEAPELGATVEVGEAPAPLDATVDQSKRRGDATQPFATD